MTGNACRYAVFHLVTSHVMSDESCSQSERRHPVIFTAFLVKPCYNIILFNNAED